MDIQLATLPDLEHIVAMRMQLFCHFENDASLLHDAALRSATSDFYAKALQTQSGRTWLAHIDGSIAGMVTLSEFLRPPYPGNLSGREAYVLNMFVAPAFRQRGVARRLLAQLMHYVQEQQYGKVWLHASAEARSMYEQAGFAPNDKALEWHPAG